MLGTKTVMVATGLFGLVLASPAFAMCGGKDGNGCQASPTTYKACSKDLKGDLKDLQCDIKDLIKDVRSGDRFEIPGDLAEIRGDIREIKFDISVLSKLSPKK